MCGYQGWFRTKGDGGWRDWRHYGKSGKFEPGSCTIDLWPDMSEYGESERFATPFKHADGSTAEVFSSRRPATVSRHFQWMKEYGIDGAFVQRFASGLSREERIADLDHVLGNCRRAAAKHGRAWVLMYDLSGMRGDRLETVAEDWKRLVAEEKLTKAKGYLHHRGKPLLAVWGIGFDDDRQYSLKDCARLLEVLREVGEQGCSLMLGVPTGWRELERDSIADPALHEVLAKADVISPWTVGRYRSLKGVEKHGEKYWAPDIAWCAEKGPDYLPVVFPGFSWHNMNPEDPMDSIPRLKGEFLKSQFVAAKQAGASMVYVAMFDEIDEATAIFKCTNDPPVGASSFLTYEGLPSDHYLKLTGWGGRLMRGEVE